MSQYTFDDIARYAEGLMETTERQLFEAALNSDPALQEQLALYHEVHSKMSGQFGRNKEQEALQATLQSMRQEFFPQQAGARVVRLRFYLRSAVAVAAIAIIALFVWQPWKTDLYQEYSETRMIASVERGGETDSILQQATVVFNKKDFTQAAKLLAMVTIKEPDNSFAAFYYGVALMQTGRTEEARKMFTQLFDGSSAFKYEAAFYMALSYLKEKDRENCARWLERINADAGNYQKAQSLKKKI